MFQTQVLHKWMIALRVSPHFSVTRVSGGHRIVLILKVYKYHNLITCMGELKSLLCLIDYFLSLTGGPAS